MADIQLAATHIDDQIETKQEKAEIQEVAIQIDDQLKNTSTETSQETAGIETEEIQEVATEIGDQSETSTKWAAALFYSKRSLTPTETSQDSAALITDELEIFMEKMVSALPGKPFDVREATIFRLPSSIHENKKELCEPNLVAIGPYHHGKENLRTMEEHKWYIFRKFLARNKGVGIKDYLQVMRSIEAKARNRYSETVDMGSNDFVKMLLLDGFFILEWAFLFEKGYRNVFCDLGWASGEILSDLCLLENQIPLFVLHELWVTHGVTGCPNCEDHCPLLELFCPVLEKMLDFTPFKPPQISCDNIYHFLHLCYLGIVPDSKPQTQCEKKKSYADILPKVCRLGSFLWSKLYPKSGSTEESGKNDYAAMHLQDTIPSISELRDAGVNFRRKKNAASMFDLSFTNGTFEMPFLQIYGPIIKILWNMVAFEQSRLPYKLPQTLSSYLALMDTLINTGNDVAILEQSDIFESYFQNAEEAATYFNQFDQIFCLYYKKHYFKGLFQDVRKYTQSTWPKYRARLMQDYFSNPWTIISVVAARILLILTVVQTYYSAAK